MNLGPDTKIKRLDHMISSDLDQATILTSLEDDKFYGLNKVASRIWELLEEARRVEEIVTELMEQFEVTEEDCRNQVMNFLSELDSAQMITEVS